MSRERRKRRRWKTNRVGEARLISIAEAEKEAHHLLGETRTRERSEREMTRRLTRFEKEEEIEAKEGRGVDTVMMMMTRRTGTVGEVTPEATKLARLKDKSPEEEERSGGKILKKRKTGTEEEGEEWMMRVS